MKKRTIWKRVSALALAAAMLVSLAACGGGETQTEEATQQTGETAVSTEETGASAAARTESEVGYVASYLEEELPVSYVNSVQAQDGKIYLQGGYYNEQTGVYENRIVQLSGSGEVENIISIADLTGAESRSVNYMVLGDGCIWAVLYEWRMDTPAEDESAVQDDWAAAEAQSTDTEAGGEDDWLSAGTQDVPEGWDTGEAETGEEAAAETETETETEDETEDETEWIYEAEDLFSSGRSVYSVAQFSMDGELLASQEIQQNEDEQWFYIMSMALGGDGNLYLCSDQTVYVYDQDLQLLCTVQVPSWIYSMLTSADGQVLVNYRNDEGNRVLTPVDVENGTMGEPLELDMGTKLFSNFSIGLDEMLYGYDSDMLCRFDLDNGVMEQVLYWLDWDINGNNLTGVMALDNGDYLLTGYSSITYEPELILLQEVPVSEIPQKTELTLGTAYVSYTLRNAILDFNRKNEQYRIRVVDYSVYETEDDYMASYSRLDQDILSGNCPDILMMANLSEDKYISSGVLADLYTLMGEDTYTKEEFVQSYLRVMEQDGALYTISPSFQINTLVGATAYVGEGQGWTMAEFLAAVEKLPEDGLILDYMTRESFLYTMLCYLLDSYIDYETGTCSFDSQEFIDLLNACMAFPEDYTAYEEFHIANGTDGGWSEDMDYFNARYEELRTGQMMLMEPNFWSISELKSGSVSCMTEDLTFIGYPGAPGNGAVIVANTTYAISASSAHPDVAWQFLCSLCSPEFIEFYSGVPVLQELLDSQLEETMVQGYYTDGEGNQIPYDWEQPLTQEQVDQVRALIDNAVCRYRYDEQIQSIITEEAAAFFAGQKDAATVADLIQNRVQIYVDEQG